MSFSLESWSPLCINCGTSVCTHVQYKCLYVPTSFKPHFCRNCGMSFQTSDKHIPSLAYKPQRVHAEHVSCGMFITSPHEYAVTLCDLTVDKTYYSRYLDVYRELYYKTNPSTEPTVMSISIVNSTFNREFAEKTFALVANGKKVTQLEVRGSAIGSHVKGGAQMYFLQFA